MPDPKVTDAGQQTRLCLALCDRLGWSDALTATRRLLKREEEIREVARQGQAEARQFRAEGMAELVSGGGPVAASRLVEVAARCDPWLDAQIEQGRAARAMEVASDAALQCRGHAAAVAVAEGPALHQRAQREAAACVKTVAKLPKLSRRAWGAPDPALEAMREGAEATWAAMLRAQDQFGLLHQFAGVLRMMGGLGAQALLPDGAPAWGYIYRRWDLALDAERELKPLHPALRLRYAIDHGWEPGLWLAGDLVKPKVERQQGPLGFLIPSPLRSLVGAE